MAINFPLSLDSLSNPSSGDKLDNPSHSTQHGDANDILEALETKLGIGASPAGSATAGFPLVHSSGGTTAWAQVGYEGITSGTATSGQVLTAGTAAGTTTWSNTGLTLIKTQSFSAVASSSVDDVFSATYDFYVIKLGITANTAATDSVINFRLRVSGTDASTNYITQRIFNTSTTVTGQVDPTGTDRWYLLESSATHPHAYATMDVFNPFAAAVTTGIAHTSFRANNNSTYMNISSFRNTNATSYTGFSLLNSTGNITGVVSVFGVQK